MSPPSFFFPKLYIMSMMPYGMGYSFGQLGSAVLPVSLPNCLCTPHFLVGRPVETCVNKKSISVNDSDSLGCVRIRQ